MEIDFVYFSVFLFEIMSVCGYRIHFNYLEHQIDWACSSYYREEGVIYFSTLKKAQDAIEVFRDELMWYYTEYRSRLDEPIHSNKT